jgi:hypothetical protein
MTTHSPYVINYLTLAVKAYPLYSRVQTEEQREKLNLIVPSMSAVEASDLVIYELDDHNGTISLLPNFDGIPSGKNYLNRSLAEGNQLFDSLLEIEETL